VIPVKISTIDLYIYSFLELNFAVFCLSFVGIATNIKLLLKLIQDHSEASTKENDDRKVQRVAGMIKIIDDAKSRIEKCQSTGKKKELRRCNTDLRPNVPRDRRSQEQMTDEKERLRKELNASLAARKSLEIMCSSLGKEKEIMASELSKKVQEMCGMEELISDLKAQNEMLLGKVQTCVEEHIEKKGGNRGDAQKNAGLHERNRALSEQLLKSLDGYRSLKRKFKDVKEENIEILATMEEMGMEVQAGLDRVRSFRQQMATRNEETVDIEEISALEHMFEGFNIKILKHGGQKKSTPRVKP
jgi:chromosome segregation ATPase